jgi:uncharacterized membrane protein
MNWLRPPRGRDILRIEGFSDAVFGFALTLLVVSLEVPSTYRELITAMRGFIPFAFSFALIVWIWYEHNMFFRRYALQDAMTIVLNSVLLFVVVFYVYPLKFVFTLMGGVFFGLTIPNPQMSRRDAATLMTVYSIGFVVIFSVMAGLYAHALRRRTALRLDELEEFDARTGLRAHLLSVGVGTLSIALALVTQHPGPAGFI